MTLSEAFVRAADEKAREYGYELDAVTYYYNNVLEGIPPYPQEMALLKFDSVEGKRHLIPVHKDAHDIQLARALVEAGLGN